MDNTMIKSIRLGNTEYELAGYVYESPARGDDVSYLTFTSKDGGGSPNNTVIIDTREIRFDTKEDFVKMVNNLANLISGQCKDVLKTNHFIMNVSLDFDSNRKPMWFVDVYHGVRYAPSGIEALSLWNNLTELLGFPETYTIPY